MANPAGESNAEVLRLDFNRRLMLQFRGSVIPSDAGLLAYRELDAALGLTTIADACTGKNGRHALVGMLRAHQARHPQPFVTFAAPDRRHCLTPPAQRAGRTLQWALTHRFKQGWLLRFSLFRVFSDWPTSPRPSSMSENRRNSPPRH